MVGNTSKQVSYLNPLSLSGKSDNVESWGLISFKEFMDPLPGLS